MAEQKDREYGKRLRDAAQAKVVIQLITVNERLPQFSFDDIKVFPTSVNDMLRNLVSEKTSINNENQTSDK